MRNRTKIASRVLASSTAVLLGSVCTVHAQSAASASTPTPQQMMDQIEALQAKVATLEASQAATKTAAQPARITLGQIDATNSAVDADAAAHSQLMDLNSPITGGWDGNKFVLRSENGDFSFHPGLEVNIRNYTSYREKLAPGGGGTDTPKATGFDTQNGFDITRLRLIFDGRLFHNVDYFVQLQGDQGNAISVLDAFGVYHLGDGPFGIKFGQFKDPTTHEKLMNDALLLANDRSFQDSLLGGALTNRVQGAGVTFDQGYLRAQGIIHDGFNSANTKFYDAGGLGAGFTGGSGVTPTNFGASGRAEYMLIGDRSNGKHPFSEYDQFSSLNATQDILVAGAGIDYSQASSNSVIFHTADLQYNNANGFSAYGSYIGTARYLNANQGVARGSYYDAGFLVQAAYVFQNHFEPFARFDFTHLAPDSVPGVANTDIQEITVGANYYFYGQHARATVDATWLPDGSPVDADAIAILRDNGHQEFLLRAQFQLFL